MRLPRAVHGILLAAVVALNPFECSAAETPGTPPISPPAFTNNLRSPKWAAKVDRPPLANFHCVTTNLYRGAQPNARGMTELKAMGFKTIINLRTFHSDDDEVRGLGLKLQRLHMKPWHSEEEDVVAFLKIMAATNNYPIFVHCQRGADRTGLVCAMYRVIFESWTREEAIQEMKDGGYNYDPRWKNIVKYIERADIEDLKRKAGMASTASATPKP